MKRTVLSYFFSLVVIICCFSAIYSIRYQKLKQEFDEQKRTDYIEGNLEPSETQAEHTSNGMEQLTSESADESEAQVGVQGELRTNSSMLYIVGRYDRNTGEVTETVEKFPQELLNLNRQELLLFLKMNPEYGSLLSFSEHAVYMRKNTRTDWEEYAYFLILEEDDLIVYQLEDDSLYLETGIKKQELSKENCELLQEGLYVKDKAALFDYLQTVTS